MHVQWAVKSLGAVSTASLGLAERLFFPPACNGCGRRVAAAGAVCPLCWRTLRFLERPWCEVMGTPFSHDMGEGCLSPEAIARPPPFRRARSALAYSGIARQMTQRLKYGDRTDLAPWMARWMVRAGQDVLADADLIVPVPLHWQRFVARRFNQSAELARAVARLTGKNFAPGCVRRVRATRQQVGLGQRERDQNMRGAFGIADTGRAVVRGRTVLVIDDVYTTGATVSALARALLMAGARNVDILTFARVIPGDFQPGEPMTI